MVAVLKVLHGDLPFGQVELRQPLTLIGRHTACEVRLDSDVISRNHARISLEAGRYFLEDLHSNNGTYLNGLRIDARVELHESDQIQLCDYAFRFHYVPDSDGGPAAIEESGDEEADDDSTKSTVVTTLGANSDSHASRVDKNPEAKLRAILKISESLCRRVTVDAVLTNLLEGLGAIFPLMDEAAALLVNPETERLELKAARDRYGHTGVDVQISQSVMQEALRTGDAILISNTAEDRRFHESESLRQSQIRALMCVPLIDQTGRSFGVIQVDTQGPPQAITRDDLDVMVSVVSQASLALQNASLHDQVHRARRFAESIVETVRDPLMVLDAELRVISANPAYYSTFQQRPAETEGRLFHQLLGGQWNVDGLPGRLTGVASGRGDLRDFEVELNLDRAGRRALLLNARYVAHEEGWPVRILLSMHDVTQSRQAAEKVRLLAADLAHASRMSVVGEMAAGVAHELHQPLAVIVNYASGCERRLRQGTADSAGLIESMREITQETLRAGEIIRCVRRFVQKREMDCRPVSINEIVEDAIQLGTFASQQRRLEVEFLRGEDLPLVFADNIQITQVVLNLLVNALEAVGESASPERHIWIHTRYDRELELEVEVADDGPGIAPATQERIFDQFFTTKTDGLGIGLAISRSIITGHGGRLWVESEPGRGATFRFTLPVAQQTHDVVKPHELTSSLS